MTDASVVAGLALLLVRPGMVVIGTPFLGAIQAPPIARAGLIVLLAIVAAPFVTLPRSPDAATLVVLAVHETAVGLALAFAVRVLITAAEFAGHVSGYQMGLSLGAVIDPQSGVRNNILALLYGNLTIVICLMTNAHHAILRALVESYAALPMAAGGVDASLAVAVAQLLGTVFVLGVRIAAPVIVVLLLVELALGLLARVAPSLNVMMSGAPVRLTVGLLVIAASVTALPDLISRYVPTALDLAAMTARSFR